MSYVPYHTPKSRLVDACVEYMAEQGKLFVTLDAKTTRTDFVTFNSQLRQWSLRINDYCYGRTFRRRENRLKIAGAIERGEISNRLHAHLMFGYDDTCRCNPILIDYSIRKLWYKVTKSSGNVFGTLANIKPIENCRSRTDYANKTKLQWEFEGEFNNVYL